MSDFWLYQGDCVKVMQSWPDASVDAVVCDPPYEIGFMGRDWDKAGVAFDPATWREALRVLKPGGHLLAFGGSRTFHRMACAIEDAGFQIRDSLMWLYGTGFPKSLNIGGGWGTALKPGYEIAVHGVKPLGEAVTIGSCLSALSANLAVPLSPSNRSAFAGEFVSALRNAALLPATPGDSSAVTGMSPSALDLLSSLSIVSSWRLLWDAHSARMNTSTTATASSLTIDLKTLNSSLLEITQACTTTVPVPVFQCHVNTAASLFSALQKHFGGIPAPVATASVTAPLPVDFPAGADSSAVILARKSLDGTVAANVQKWGTGALNIDGCRIPTTDKLVAGGSLGVNAGDTRTGKALGMFQEGTPNTFKQHSGGRWPANVMLDEEAAAMLDRQADASRFFYVAKTSRRERDHGLDAFPARSAGEATDREDGSAGLSSPRAGAGRTGGSRNMHPCVKPVALMRQLVRLVTPPGGIVLDPFVGSGSTGMAARLEGARFVGIDLSEEYLAIAHARIAAALTLK